MSALRSSLGAALSVERNARGELEEHIGGAVDAFKRDTAALVDARLVAADAAVLREKVRYAFAHAHGAMHLRMR